MPHELELVEIEGGVARVVKRTVQREVPTDDYIRALAAISPVETGVLPQGALYMSHKGRGEIYVHQTPPCARRLRWRSNLAGGYEVPLPWLQWFGLFYGGELREVMLTGSNGPVDRLEATVAMPPLPNLHTPVSVVCMGDVRFDSAPPKWNRLMNTANNILGSEWNADLAPNWPRLRLQAPDFEGAVRTYQHVAGTHTERDVRNTYLAEVDLRHGLGYMSVLHLVEGQAIYDCPMTGPPWREPRPFSRQLEYAQEHLESWGAHR